VNRSRFRLALLAVLAVWFALRIAYWNGFYTEDSPGYVTDAIWAAVGNYHVRDHVNGLNVGTYLPVALPIAIFGKSEAALSVWPLACSLLGVLSAAGIARVFFGEAAAIVAGLLYATYPGDVFFSTVVMPDAVQSGWLSLSIFLVALAQRDGARSRLLLGGVALGICHLARANDVLLLPVGILAAVIGALVWRRRNVAGALLDAAAYVAGWSAVLVIEGTVYAVTVGDFLWRLRVVQHHYGTADAIAKAGLNVDPRTIPFSVFAPISWWARGEWFWHPLNQDQAYHGLLFCWAVLLLTAGAAAARYSRRERDPRLLAALGVAAVWLFWPLFYHQFGSQSLTSFVPMHRLSRHLVVYAPGAIFAIVAGGAALAQRLREAGSASLSALAATLALAAFAAHLAVNRVGERISFSAYHTIKDTYARILEHLPSDTRSITADPGDLCFFDFWMNPLGSERVRMVAFAGVRTCAQIEGGVVLTRSNPGWSGGAPVILETVRRLPCLTAPPPHWRLLYRGYPEQVFVVTRQ
jgi:4-amino-4-deoxy-L-arabinose transferase-like glycosyltransferase